MNQDVARLMKEIVTTTRRSAYALIYARIVDTPPSDDNPILFQKFVPDLLAEARNSGFQLETAYPEVDGFAEALTGRTVFVFRRES